MKHLPVLLALLLLASCGFNANTQAKSVLSLMGFMGGGTGFVVFTPSGKRVILTNRHVCEAAILFAQSDTRTQFISIIEASDKTDLCAIQVGNMEGGLALATAEPQPFDPIHIIGQGLLLGNTLTEGTWVGHLGPLLGVESPAYATATILPGNSGSPVFNDSGYVVGVAFASSDEINMRALIVPLSDIKEFLKDM